MEYVVTWTMEIDAKNPYDAADIARAIQLDSASLATVFEVAETGGSRWTVDLTEKTIDRKADARF